MVGNIVDLQLLPRLRGQGRDHWPHPKRYVVELHPVDRAPYRAEIDIPPIDYPDDFFFSQPGDVTGFIVNPATGEVRFDMTDQRNSRAAHLAGADVLEQQLLAGVPADPGLAVTGPPWVVPATCPGCGAPVDQATQAMAPAPTCAFCDEPLPAQPRARF